MNWNVHTNVLGGRSISIPPGHDLQGLPSEFSAFLTSAYREAYENPKAYFQALSGNCEFDGIRSFYASIALAGACSLQVHTAEPAPGHVQSDVIFRVSLPNHTDFGFSLPRGGFIGHLPAVLQRLYSRIGSTVEGEVWASGGIVSSDIVGLHLGDYSVAQDGRFGSTDRVSAFYKTDTGDYLFVYEDEAFWFRHEDCGFVEVGPITGVINQYFNSMLGNSDSLRDPHSIS